MTQKGVSESPKRPEPISREVLLLVEGRAMVGFFLGLLDHLGVPGTVDIRDYGGKDELRAYVRTIALAEGFGDVKSVGLVRDAEDDPRGALQSMKGALKNAGLAVPRTVGQIASGCPATAVFVLPDAKSPGMLESLCWRAIVERMRAGVACIEEFLACVEKETGARLPNADKSRVYAYLSTRKKPDELLGQAARARDFPWDSEEFNALKTFIRNLLP